MQPFEVIKVLGYNDGTEFLDVKNRHVYFTLKGEIRRRNQYSPTKIGRKIVDLSLLDRKEFVLIKKGRVKC